MTDSALDEIDFGEFTGRRFEELDADPRWREWNIHRSTARCPGGEAQGEAQARALAFAFEAAARHRRAPLLVTHCDIIRSLHCWSARLSLDDIHSIDCPPGSLSSLDLSGEQQAAA
jgi:probable phosphoglycerate mutase